MFLNKQDNQRWQSQPELTLTYGPLEGPVWRSVSLSDSYLMAADLYVQGRLF